MKHLDPGPFISFASQCFFAQSISEIFLEGGGVFTGGMICVFSSARLGSAFIGFFSEFFSPHDFFLVALCAMIPLHIIFSLPQTLVVIEWENKTSCGCYWPPKCFTVLSVSYYTKSIRLVL